MQGQRSNGKNVLDFDMLGMSPVQKIAYFVRFNALVLV